MGFEFTQGLIIGKNTLLVERPSDILHLQAVSSVLRKQKRAFLDPAWAICPAGGIDKVPGSVGAAWQEWIQTEAWSRLAPSTRYKIWWEAWNKRIEPFFGDCAPDSITMKMIDEWRADMETRDRRRPQSAEDLPSFLACDASASLYAANRPLEKGRQ